MTATPAAPVVVIRNERPQRPAPVPAAAQAPQPAAAPVPVAVEPFAPPARRRFRGALSFLGAVALPVALCAGYLWGFAADRYETGFSFSVRSPSEQPAQASAMAAMMGGGGGASSDAGVLADFITSREMASRLIQRGVDLPVMFSATADRDPVFSLRHPDDPEEVAAYWERAVSAERDPQTGIVRVSVEAFSPKDALVIAQAAMEESRKLVDELSAQSKADLMRSSEAEVARAEAEREEARKALTEFRVRNAIVDPETSLAGRVATLDELRAALDKETLARADIAAGSRSNDPRLAQADVRLDNLRALIAERTAEFGDDAGYARLASEYEDLQARAEFADITLRNAMTVRDAARKEADTRAAYLTAHVLPHEPGSAGAPDRWVLTGIAAGFLLGLWLLMRLVAAAVRERF